MINIQTNSSLFYNRIGKMRHSIAKNVQRFVPFRKSLKTLLANTVLLCALSSCSQMGPKFIEGSRTDYNVAMGNTESEQISLIWFVFVTVMHHTFLRPLP